MARKSTRWFEAGLGVALTILLAANAQAQDVPPPDQTSDNDIIVTATKRDESARDIAGTVTAVSERTLQRLNAQSLADYITRVPGVVFNDYQPGVSEVVIRGIASTTYHEANQATTGYYLNEVPLIEPGFPLVIPDVDAFDVARVEVLRGPQGTLFGSSSLGGAINYVVNEADASRIDLGAEGILSSTKRSGEASYTVKGMVNVPLIADRLAIRVVALQRSDAGYLDNTLLGRKGSNDLRVRGLRASIVFTPTDTTRLSVLSMYQEYKLDDQTYVLFGPPKTFERATNVAEYQNTDFMLHSARLEQDLGFATLTGIASYVRKRASLLFDYSVFGGNDPRTDTPLLAISDGDTSKTYYGELRLASAGTGPFRWLIGANYTRLRTRAGDRGGLYTQGLGAYIDANPGEFGNQPSSVIAPGDFIERTISDIRVREEAVFGEVSYKLTPSLELTLGGRYFRYTSRNNLQLLPNAALTPPFDYRPDPARQSGFVPKASLKYQPNRDFSVYALYSEGFRIGGVNTFSLATTGLPLTFDSDKTKNYEVGTRVDLADRTLSIDLTAYHIDWKNIQARLFTPGDFRAYTVNGGGAKIDGVELTLTMRPTRHLTFASNVSYNDARLSALLPDSFAPGGGYGRGTKLPGASDWTISNTLDLGFEDTRLKPRIGIAHRYLSAAPVAFGPSLEKGDFHVIDVNSALTLAERVEIGLFAKNLFNQYGILSAPFQFAGAVQRPRTVGASLRLRLR